MLRGVFKFRVWAVIAVMFSSRVCVATEALKYGLFVSMDRGVSWVQADIGLRAEARINALAGLGNVVVAGTDAGIFVSTKDAKSWRAAVIAGVERARVMSVISLKDQLLAGTAEGLLLESADGNHWETNKTFPRRLVRSLHAIEDVVYVGTDADFVFRSTDQGKTWSQISAGLPERAQVSAMTSVGGTLFAGLYAQGLYRWNATEQKWNRVGAAAGIKPLVLAASGDTLIAGHNPGGIFWSHDLGESWERWTLSEMDGMAPALDLIFNSGAAVTNARAIPATEAPIWEMAADSKIAVAGAGSGIYLSTDKGRKWTRATKGLPTNAPGIAFYVHGDVIFAAVHLRAAGCEADATK
jgi:photosystem II stability/assembly factor-like uncharacterized protein